MTARQLIRKLEIFDRQYPGRAKWMMRLSLSHESDGISGCALIGGMTTMSFHILYGKAQLGFAGFVKRAQKFWGRPWAKWKNINLDSPHDY